MTYVFVLLMLFLFFIIWLAVCNQRTLTERHKLINLIYAQEDWETLRAQLDEISYSRHLWRLMTFRSAYKAYNDRVRSLL